MPYGYPDKCPECDQPLDIEAVDIGVGMLVNPASVCCPCGWDFDRGCPGDEFEPFPPIEAYAEEFK